jgi:hypothetical protein
MIREMVEAFVDANMDRADISVALHQVAADVGGPLIKRINQRSRKTVEAMLETASDIKSPPDKFAIDLMLSATAGADAYLAGGSTIAGAGPQNERPERVTSCDYPLRALSFLYPLVPALAVARLQSLWVSRTSPTCLRRQDRLRRAP